MSVINPTPDGRSVTLVVAASKYEPGPIPPPNPNGSSAASYGSADYQCNGTNDMDTIYQAINALPPAGGTIKLTEGYFWREHPLAIDRSYVTIEGSGDATVITCSSDAAGPAHIIIGSNGLYQDFDNVQGLTGYTAPQTSPTAYSVPTEIKLRNFMISDYESDGVAITGSSGGIINRGSTVHIEDVTVKVVELDGIRYEAFRAMRDSDWTLSSGGNDAPAWSPTATETWTVNASGATPSFYAILQPATGYDYDPEIVYVSATSGTSWTVSRGWGQTTIKAHPNNSKIYLLNLAGTYNNVTENCYVYSPLRSGIMVEGLVEDSEWLTCIIEGGDADGFLFTTNGIYSAGADTRFIDCHPYFCSQYGFIGGFQSSYGSPPSATTNIIGGEYENCGTAGIYAEYMSGLTITGGTALYSNATYNIELSNVNNFRISDNWMYSPVASDENLGSVTNHLLVSDCNQGTVHDNVMTGVTTGEMILVSGVGADSGMAEITIHDNVCGISGGYKTAIGLASTTGVNVHDNTCEASIVESGTSDYNRITGNSMVNTAGAFPVITLNTPNHTRSYDNPGQTQLNYQGAGTGYAQSDQVYQLDASSGSVTLYPPGGGATWGASIGVTPLGGATITLTSSLSKWPASGYALVPVTGGWQVINYTGISGSDLTGCSGGSGNSASGTAYSVPDLSLNFQFVATSITHGVTIECPAGCQINGASSNLSVPAAGGHFYTGVLSASGSVPNWLIY